MSEELFDPVELVSMAPEPTVEPNRFPYFLVAYWPRGKYWVIKAAHCYGDPCSPGLRADIAEMQERGWTHVTVCKLPELP